jgi:purine-cytosine permease-like protein
VGKLETVAKWVSGNVLWAWLSELALWKWIVTAIGLIVASIVAQLSNARPLEWFIAALGALGAAVLVILFVEWFLNDRRRRRDTSALVPTSFHQEHNTEAIKVVIDGKAVSLVEFSVSVTEQPAISRKRWSGRWPFPDVIAWAYLPDPAPVEEE